MHSGKVLQDYIDKTSKEMLNGEDNIYVVEDGIYDTNLISERQL